MITIIEDETKMNFVALKCENCGETRLARHIQATGIFGESRGSYIICFKCFGPVVRWKDERNIVFESPVRKHAVGPLPIADDNRNSGNAGG